MPRIIRVTLISLRDLLATVGPFVLVALVLLAGAYFILKPTPPKRVVLATGPEDSAYAEFGKRYAEDLKRYGITVVLKATRGSYDNLHLLRDPKQDVDLAFVQGGASETVRASEEAKTGMSLVSLGSLFYEPVWIFYRAEAARELPGGVLTGIEQLRGWRVNLGALGSGAPGLMRKLLAANGLDRGDIKYSYLELTPAVVALLDGKLDAIAFVSAPEVPIVQMLLQTPGVKLLEFPQGEAYARRYAFLSPVVLPRGVVDIARNVPAHDVPLIASTTSLVARAGTHPALLQLFVQAAARIHGGAGWIARAGQFPSAKASEFPLAPEAERFYRAGPPLLQRYLPLWLANLVDRMWVALFSIVAVLIPLSRVLPPLYEFRIRSRVFRWYRQLRNIEDRIWRADEAPADLLAELERLDGKAERVAVPLSYMDELYNLRGHIALVRARLRQTR